MPQRINLALSLLDPAADRGGFLLRSAGLDGHDIERLTRAELRERVLRVAAGVAHRTRVGDRVFVQCTDPVATAVAFLAVVAAARVAVPLRADLPTPDLRRFHAHVGPRLTVHDAFAEPSASTASVDELAAFPPLLDVPLVAADVPAFLIFTSGTTSRPRAAIHGHAWARGRRAIVDGWSGARPGDSLLHTGRMFWTYALGSGLADALLVDAETTLFQATPSTPSLIHRLRSYPVDVLATVPALLRRIVRFAAEHGEDVRAAFRSVRATLSAGEHLPAPLRLAFEAATGTTLHEAFGATECSTFVSTRPGLTPRPGWVGPLQPGRNAALLDPPGERLLAGAGIGQIAARADDPGLFLGYWGEPRHLVEVDGASYHPTGDLFERDADGWFRFVGRADEQLNALGVRLSPMEIEAILETHPDIAEVAVWKLSREDKELLTAFVVPATSTQRADPGALEATLAAIRAWAATQLAAHRLPKVYRLVESLPRTPSGKLRRRALEDVETLMER